MRRRGGSTIDQSETEAKHNPHDISVGSLRAKEEHRTRRRA
jgi:hypothetical protein